MLWCEGNCKEVLIRELADSSLMTSAKNATPLAISTRATSSINDPDIMISFPQAEVWPLSLCLMDFTLSFEVQIKLQRTMPRFGKYHGPEAHPDRPEAKTG
jgi:hypothetical protein